MFHKHTAGFTVQRQSSAEYSLATRLSTKAQMDKCYKIAKLIAK